MEMSVLYRGLSFTPTERLRITDEGLVWKGTRKIAWHDVLGMRAFPAIFGDSVFGALGILKPRLSIYLRGGEVLSLRGDLMTAATSDASTMDGLPAVYVSVVRALRAAGIPDWAGPREEGIAARTCAAAGIFAAAMAWIVSRAAFDVSADLGLSIAIGAGVIVGNVAYPLSAVVGRRVRAAYLKGDALHRT